MRLKSFLYLFIVLIITVIFSLTATAGISVERVDPTGTGDKKLIDAVRVVEEIMALKEKGKAGIPQRILSSTHGIAIIPGAFKASLGVGGRFGKGVLLVRKKDKSWSEPSFITIAGGSLGWQIGAQSTDIVLVFNEAKSIKGVTGGKLTLGVDATIAAGDFGRHIEASTDERAKAEIYSYSRSRGLFIGVSLEGGVLQIDDKLNSAYYNRPGLGAKEIFSGKAENVPVEAEKLRRAVKEYVSKQ